MTLVHKRPFSDSFESKKNLKAEEEISQEIFRRSGHLPNKLPKRDVIDFAMTVDDRLKEFLEVRTRTISSEGLKEIPITLKKFVHIRNLFEATKLQTAIVIVFSDRRLRIWLGKRETFPVEMFGCNSSNDTEYDREPCVMIPIERFEELFVEKEMSDEEAFHESTGRRYEEKEEEE